MFFFHELTKKIVQSLRLLPRITILFQGISDMYYTIPPLLTCSSGGKDSTTRGLATTLMGLPNLHLHTPAEPSLIVFILYVWNLTQAHKSEGKYRLQV